MFLPLHPFEFSLEFGGESNKIISSWVHGTLDGLVALWCLSGDFLGAFN
jgi:hypothetical protein